MTDIHLIVLDTETSGLDPQRDCIIEIATMHLAISTHRSPGETEAKSVTRGGIFHRYVLPTVPVSVEAAAINGYDEEMWRHHHDAISINAALYDLVEWLNRIGQENLMWTGSNVSAFDLAFLKRAFSESGLAMPGKPLFSHRTLNTESLCFPLLVQGKVEHCGLASLRAWAGHSGEQKHNAFDDALDTCLIIETYLCQEVWRDGK